MQVEYDDKTFIDVLDMLVQNYNNTHHSVHDYTPNEVYNGTKEILIDALKRSQEYHFKRIFWAFTQDDPIPVG